VASRTTAIHRYLQKFQCVSPSENIPAFRSIIAQSRFLVAVPFTGHYFPFFLVAAFSSYSWSIIGMVNINVVNRNQPPN
jgi:hypothetical protein